MWLLRLMFKLGFDHKSASSNTKKRTLSENCEKNEFTVNLHTQTRQKQGKKGKNRKFKNKTSGSSDDRRKDCVVEGHIIIL